MGAPLARPQGRIEERWSFDARSWESIRPAPFGPSRSSRLSHECRVKETIFPREKDTAVVTGSAVVPDLTNGVLTFLIHRPPLIMFCGFHG